MAALGRRSMSGVGHAIGRAKHHLGRFGKDISNFGSRAYSTYKQHEHAIDKAVGIGSKLLGHPEVGEAYRAAKGLAGHANNLYNNTPVDPSKLGSDIQTLSQVAHKLNGNAKRQRLA